MSIARALRARNYSRRLVRSFPLFVLVLGMALIVPAGTGHSAQATLAWDANTEPNLAGYKVYYGTASHNYGWVLNVGKVTTCTVTGLTDGLTYYFAATAYNTSNLESAPSGEVSYNTTTASQSRIFWRNNSTGENAVWFLDGLTVTGTAFFPTVNDPYWTVVGTGDFNKDGKIDILWRNTSTGANAVWLLDGVTVTSTNYLTTLYDPKRTIMGTGDFNKDGKTDILGETPPRAKMPSGSLTGSPSPELVPSLPLTILTGPLWVPGISTRTAKPISSGETPPRARMPSGSWTG